MQSLCPATYLLSVQAHYITHLGPIWTPSQPQNGQRQALKHHVFLTVLVRVWIMPPAHPPPSIQQTIYQFFQTIVLVDHQGIHGPATGYITFCLTYYMFPNIIWEILIVNALETLTEKISRTNTSSFSINSFMQMDILLKDSI